MYQAYNGNGFSSDTSKWAVTLSCPNEPIVYLKEFSIVDNHEIHVTVPPHETEAECDVELSTDAGISRKWSLSYRAY